MRLLLVIVSVLACLAVLGAATSATAADAGGEQGPQRVGRRPRIAIIGGGIGGAAVAYYLNKHHGSFDVHLFEQHSELGGRLKHISWPGVDGPIELGGDAWANVNHYVSEIVKELDIPVDLTRRSNTGAHTQQSASQQQPQQEQQQVQQRRKQTQQTSATTQHAVGVPPKMPELAIWQGRALFDIMHFLEKDVISDAVIAEDTVGFLGKLNLNYLERGQFEDGKPFRNISMFLHHGGLSTYTGVTSLQYFGQQRAISATAKSFYLEPLVRVIYGQNLTAHSFATLVSLVSMTSAHSCAKGNSYLVQQMAHNATKNINVNARVTRIHFNDTANTFSVKAAKPNLDDVDAVVVALPLEFLSASWSNINITADFRPRPFVSCTVTIVEAAGLRPARFNAPPNATMPEQILTTANATSDGFTAVQLVATTAANRSVYKLTTVGGADNTTLDSMFVDRSRVVQHTWHYTFPRLNPFSDPLPPLYQPIEVAPNVFHVNAMESVASAMEGSVIAARNIAQLLTRRFSTYWNGSDAIQPYIDTVH
ncbi:hypothetical protein PTSG_10804 [Salpingoeca rosetta]|uniref:Prenylcysteine lyase domain-containing protein n=1 Tax=Salpingoeca rosetta (strain ATCC 50818 / BSB-021) TaxID=946362 RepID=F2UPZ1_SALR5|nr:uncharacterized protein PTSG_10804 [Salpingoeca rosetta]EGD79821.1 hypothetical protein PTSG_10804 [Salpingoeca rosetta]|eukprot:XP_004988769.1 hypothetical protein PTSG_10804 [Salpingoeca rosetta]